MNTKHTKGFRVLSATISVLTALSFLAAAEKIIFADESDDGVITLPFISMSDLENYSDESSETTAAEKTVSETEKTEKTVSETTAAEKTVSETEATEKTGSETEATEKTVSETEATEKTGSETEATEKTVSETEAAEKNGNETEAIDIQDNEKNQDNQKDEGNGDGVIVLPFIPFDDISTEEVYPLIGDLNGDGAVSAIDLLELKNLILDSDNTKSNYNADIDGNGKIDVEDLVLLIKMLIN